MRGSADSHLADSPFKMDLADISWLDDDDAEMMRRFYIEKYGYCYDGIVKDFNKVGEL